MLLSIFCFRYCITGFPRIGFIILLHTIDNYQWQYIFDSSPCFITVKIQLTREKLSHLENPGGLLLCRFVYVIFYGILSTNIHRTSLPGCAIGLSFSLVSCIFVVIKEGKLLKIFCCWYLLIIWSNLIKPIHEKLCWILHKFPFIILGSHSGIQDVYEHVKVSIRVPLLLFDHLHVPVWFRVSILILIFRVLEELFMAPRFDGHIIPPVINF